MGKGTVFLPCTLLARSRPNYLEYEEKSYRGSIILLPAPGTGFRIVNYLPVEDYLRGVVPLEIGRRNLSEIEAVKAQAIAARTYTYRKIAERTGADYDVLPTVADQVYGGVGVEQPLCDMAVRLTDGLVMTWNGSPIFAYYHSTCGGMTANIEDVWSRAAQPYLRAVRDVDRHGKAYCASSRYFSWEQKWTPAQLSAIVARYGPATFSQIPPLRGTITDVDVKQCYDCGRVAQCRIESPEGTVTYGGDRVRFVLRRPGSGDPILYSARFSVAAANRKEIRLQGKGNGHGVGMCQMGAIGRAAQGQNYHEILQAYYPGIKIERLGE
jgi:stage II sporulation protein D